MKNTMCQNEGSFVHVSPAVSYEVPLRETEASAKGEGIARTGAFVQGPSYVST